MTAIKVTTAGIERMQRRMTQRVNFLGDGLRPVLRQSADDLEEVYRKNIQSFTPGSVQDLAESTKKQKQRQVGFVYPILVRTSQMINSMYTRISVARRGGWTIKLGFSGSQNGVENSRIAEIHIKGEGRMPKRDFTKIPSSWKSVLFRRIRVALEAI